MMMEEMNEVNDFMEQFGSDFEIKWGIGLDPDLGNKVKVTILATGFGIRDVDGMDSHIKKIVQEKDEKRNRGRDTARHTYGYVLPRRHRQVRCEAPSAHLPFPV